jgi:hypothetical protein
MNTIRRAIAAESAAEIVVKVRGRQDGIRRWIA